jgi:hypothetical protein
MTDLTRQMHIVVALDRMLVDKLNSMPRPQAQELEAALHDPSRRGFERKGDRVTVFLDGEPFISGSIG